MLSELLLRFALDHVARGWPVFPLRPGDKRPAIRDWEGRATTDPNRIRRAWTAAPYNVGVGCGRAALVVVDLDTPKPGTDVPARWRQPGIVDGTNELAALADHAGARLPIQTYTVGTASGGQHLYFAAPEGPPLRNTAGRLGWLIDTRAAGGYVVGAGSTMNGRSYTPILDLPVTPLPPWITGLLRTTERPPTPSGPPAADSTSASPLPKGRRCATPPVGSAGSSTPAPPAATSSAPDQRSTAAATPRFSTYRSRRSHRG